jgi:tetratricopeptide (TPR) repeat protein
MRRLILAACLLPAAGFAAENLSFGAGRGYLDCIGLVESMPQAAFERANTWRAQNGGAAAEHCMALALLKLGQPTEAALALESVARKMEMGSVEERVTLLHQAGNAWLLARAANPAEAAFTAAIRLNERDPALWTERARARALRQDWSGAESDLTAAIAIERGDAEMYVLRSSARRALGRMPEADADVTAALAINPNHPSALVERGARKLAAGDRNGARADFATVLRTAPRSGAADAARDYIEGMDFNPDR